MGSIGGKCGVIDTTRATQSQRMCVLTIVERKRGRQMARS